MIRYLLLLLILGLGYSCKEEEVASWDDLTAGEQEALRQRARTKCYASSNSDLADIKDKSNLKLSKYERGYHWKIEVAGQTDTDNLYVWKNDGTNIYFLYQTANKVQFIKMTQAFNSEIFDHLRLLKCEKADPNLVVSLNSSSFSIKRLDIPETCSGERCRVDYTYTGSSTVPAFFFVHQYTKKQEILDDDGDVTSTKNLEYKISYIGEEDEKLEDFYTDYSGREYCVFEYSGTPKVIEIPFKLACSTNADPNTFGDASLNFPASELNL